MKISKFSIMILLFLITAGLSCCAGLRENFSSKRYDEKYEFCMNRANIVIQAVNKFYDDFDEYPPALNYLISEYLDESVICLTNKEYEKYNIHNRYRGENNLMFEYSDDQPELIFRFAGPGMNVFGYVFAKQEWWTEEYY